MEKVKKGARAHGPAYIHVLAVCPTGWRSAPDLSIRLGRLAVETGIFPLYEVVDGKYKITIDVPKLRPVEDYFRLQGRFRHLTKDMIETIQQRVQREYDRLKQRAKADWGG
jgi:pyruvate ferredoxin oxidoreductase beta subunit